MPAFIDLSGQRFGRLVVIDYAEKINGRSAFICQCDCGNTITTTSNSLQQGKTASCGCIRKELSAAQAQGAGTARGKRMMKHGLSGTRLYSIWKSMRERCNNIKDRFYSEYGGRGIRVCSQWDEYINFHNWAMAKGYDPNAPFGQCTIDRIDVNGNYCPENCRWVDVKTQNNNRRKRRCMR